MVTVRIRQSTVEDGEALAGLLVEMHAHYGRVDPKRVWVRVHKAYFPEGEAECGPLVALVDGVPVGFAVYDTFGEFSGRPQYSAIQEFFVTERARRRGVGSALLEAVCARAAESGSRHVVLGYSNPLDLDPSELRVILHDEVYINPSLLPRGPDREAQEQRRQLCELAARSGWDPPVVIDRRGEIFDFSDGDVLAEGDVPFAILRDGRVVRVHFETTWESSYFGEDERTTWRLTLDGRELRRPAAFEIDSSWTRGTNMPQQAQPHSDGGEGVHYDFHLGHHLATVRGTIEYIFDVPALCVRTVEHVEIDTSP